jgi:hypothetical protein
LPILHLQKQYPCHWRIKLLQSAVKYFLIAKDNVTTNKQLISGPAALWRCHVLLLPRFFQATVTSSLLINQLNKKFTFYISNMMQLYCRVMLLFLQKLKIFFNKRYTVGTILVCFKTFLQIFQVGSWRLLKTLIFANRHTHNDAGMFQL